jgi:hypothetical protein
MIIPPTAQLHYSVYTPGKYRPKRHYQRRQEASESPTRSQFLVTRVFPGLISSDSECEVETSERKEDERYDLKDQTREHEVVPQVHGSLLCCSARHATTGALQGERDDVAGYEEAGVPYRFDAGYGIAIGNHAAVELVRGCL